MDWRIIIATFVLVAWISIVPAVEIDYSHYCRPEYDCYGKEPGSHVMCSYPKTWSSSCVGQQFVAMSDARKKFIIDSHNTRRNALALGQLGGKFRGRKAARMAKMHWDEELEMFAQKNLLKCRMQNDQCRRTQQFISVGQAQAEYKCDEPHATVDEFLQDTITTWWNEHLNITYIDNKNIYESIRSHQNVDFGHFTQMAQDKAMAMGCAIISRRNGYCHNLVCNYAITNIIDEPIYEVGPTRSRCITNSSSYPGLCGANEDYLGSSDSFRRDNTRVPPLKQWIANGYMLDVPYTASYVERNPAPSRQQSSRAPTTQSRATERRTERQPSIPREESTYQSRLNQRINNWMSNANVGSTSRSQAPSQAPTRAPTQTTRQTTRQSGTDTSNEIFGRMLNEMRRRYP